MAKAKKQRQRLQMSVRCTVYTSIWVKNENVNLWRLWAIKMQLQPPLNALVIK